MQNCLKSSPQIHTPEGLAQPSESAGCLASHNSETAGTPGRVRLSEQDWAASGPTQVPTDTWTHTHAESCTHRHPHTHKCDQRSVIGLQNKSEFCAVETPIWARSQGTQKESGACTRHRASKVGSSLPAAGLLCPTEPRAHLSLIRETMWGEGAREAWGWAGGPECVTFSRHRPCDGRSDSVLTVRDGSGFR